MSEMLRKKLERNEMQVPIPPIPPMSKQCDNDSTVNDLVDAVIEQNIELHYQLLEIARRITGVYEISPQENNKEQVLLGLIEKARKSVDVGEQNMQLANIILKRL